MKIIIEGCDGVGKTELCDRLHIMTGLPVIHLNEKVGRYDTFIKLAMIDNIIFDRQIISEYVYAKATGRKQKVSLQDIHLFLEHYKKSKGKIYIINRSKREIKEALKEKGETYNDYLIKRVLFYYDEVASLFNIPIIENDKDLRLIAEDILNEGKNF